LYNSFLNLHTFLKNNGISYRIADHTFHRFVSYHTNFSKLSKNESLNSTFITYFFFLKRSDNFLPSFVILPLSSIIGALHISNAMNNPLAIIQSPIIWNVLIIIVFANFQYTLLKHPLVAILIVG